MIVNLKATKHLQNILTYASIADGEIPVKEVVLNVVFTSNCGLNLIIRAFAVAELANFPTIVASVYVNLL